MPDFGIGLDAALFNQASTSGVPQKLPMNPSLEWDPDKGVGSG
jgi:hypothetical protein